MCLGNSVGRVLTTLHDHFTVPFFTKGGTCSCIAIETFEFPQGFLASESLQQLLPEY